MGKERLGWGTDGAVWKTSARSALKVFLYQRNFADELESYLRLQAKGIISIGKFAIPLLIDSDAELLAIEMSIVQPPYLLDFGKVYFDRPPTDVYDEGRLREAEGHAQRLFGERWSEVAGLLYMLQEKVGIWYVDPKPANINFGDIDDPDWNKEPGLDYSEYDVD